MPRPTDWPVIRKTPGFVTVGAVSTLVLDENVNRLTFSAVNCGDEVCYLSEGVAAVIGSGDALYPRGSAYMSKDDLYLGAIYAICATGGLNLAITEGSSV